MDFIILYKIFSFILREIFIIVCLEKTWNILSSLIIAPF